MKKSKSKKTKQTRSASLSRSVKKALVLLICAVLLTNATLPKTEQKVEAVEPITLTGLGLAGLVFTLLGCAGIAVESEKYFEERDILLSDEYDLANYGYVEGEYIDGDAMWADIELAATKGSKLAKEIIDVEGRIVDSEDWELSTCGGPNQPPSDPNKHSLKKLLVGTALSLQINAALLSPINDVSQALQMQAQQQMQYSIYSNYLDDTIFNDLNLLETNTTASNYSITGFKNSLGKNYFYTIPSDAIIVDCSQLDIHNSLQHHRFIFSNHEFTYDGIEDGILDIPRGKFNNVNNFYYKMFDDYNNGFINPPDLSIGEVSKDFKTDYKAIANYIYENYGIGGLLGQQRTPYVPDMIGNKGHITNIGDIRPVYNNNQYFSYPTTNEIQNFYDNIKNYYDTTNNDFSTDQQNIANYFNDFIQQHVHENEPVVTPAPSAAPATSAPDPSAGPLPSVPPDDDNENYTTPDLKNFFPFCIPWDIYDMFAKFTENRKAPVIEFHLKSDMFGFDHPVKIDLSSFDEVAAVCRLLELILFIIGLAVATRKLIGAGG